MIEQRKKEPVYLSKQAINQRSLFVSPFRSFNRDKLSHASSSTTNTIIDKRRLESIEKICLFKASDFFLNDVVDFP